MRNHPAGVEKMEESTTTSVVPYSEFVRALAKPGEVMLAEMTPEKLHLWHMSSALLDEVAELAECMVDYDQGKKTNAIEEFGDMRFYLQGICNAIDENLDYTFAACHGVQIRNSDMTETLMLLIAAGKLFDAVKRYVIYNGQLDRVKLVDSLVEVVRSITRLYLAVEVSDEIVERANRVKLGLRYTKLTYGDQAAQQRADKPAGE